MSPHICAIVEASHNKAELRDTRMDSSMGDKSQSLLEPLNGKFIYKKNSNGSQQDQFFVAYVENICKVMSH